MKILLGVTGSVATTGIKHLIANLQADGHEVKVVATKNAMYFLRGQFPLGVDFYDDQKELVGNSYKKNQSIPHIELGGWADVFVVAPLSANTLAKFANGLCDNLLTNVFRAWDFDKPVILAPEMSTGMWNNRFTKMHLTTLAQFQSDNDQPAIEVIQPFHRTHVRGDDDYFMQDPTYIVRIVSALEKK